MQEQRDARKIAWECPKCTAIVENSTFKITNGKNKGLTLKQKHMKSCDYHEAEMEEEIKGEVSSTEERIKEGERQKDIKYKKRVKKCQFRGCGIVYKGDSVLYFKKYIKNWSFKNQKELGGWIVRTSRKFDFDVQDNSS